jgi:hypothetical protein
MAEKTIKIGPVLNPMWLSQLTAAKDSSLLQIEHPEHGMLSFILPPNEAERLGVFLLKQAGVACDRLGLEIEKLKATPTVGSA